MRTFFLDIFSFVLYDACVRFYIFSHSVVKRKWDGAMVVTVALSISGKLAGGTPIKAN